MGPTFTQEDIYSGLYDARHVHELELTRLTIDDDVDSYWRAVRGAQGIDEQIAKLRLRPYDAAAYLTAEDDYRDEIRAQGG